MLSEFFTQLLSFSFGKKSFQAFYKKLYSLSLRGMNYGIVDSGEENVLKILSLELSKSNVPLVLFDIGANVGTYTQTLLKNFPKNSRIFSFEPSKKTFQELKKNIGAEEINLFNVGLGERPESINLYSTDNNSTLASAYQRTSDENETLNIEKIEIITLDNFCQDNNIDNIDFMKVDVEGYEINVFKGASESLSNKIIKTIQFEFGGTQIQARVFLKDFYDLLSPNYILFRILKDGLEPIEKYNERLENFNYSNYLAILKK
ncbi:FkbM family methyltransferase [Arcticibacterium luteifluviistationis]|uniref:Methyltransferase FkbM domain-containing protein n=1 Tax=Arcticibacterium luteifluviistationis TaxID=1784714 RepID=A0A2Z4GEK7_9BACT|nr:FkbM family methyltransferase [Arcticibacterium luteifluviistationis]AWV99686.1 hypothetical protein DJ013_16505 [Arcticibacterium luteifluviistationis]